MRPAPQCLRFGDLAHSTLRHHGGYRHHRSGRTSLAARQIGPKEDKRRDVLSLATEPQVDLEKC